MDEEYFKETIATMQIILSDMGKEIGTLKDVNSIQNKRIEKLQKEIREVYAYYGIREN